MDGGVGIVADAFFAVVVAVGWPVKEVHRCGPLLFTLLLLVEDGLIKNGVSATKQILLLQNKGSLQIVLLLCQFFCLFLDWILQLWAI